MSRSRSNRAATRNPYTVKLTPELFRELDILTRTRCGRVIEVCTPEEMKGAFAQTFLMLGSAYSQVGIRRFTEVGIITLVNEIDVPTFRGTARPEMDWSKVPEESIYRFLIFHEISHCVLDAFVFDLPRSWWSDGSYQKFLIANEIRADRFAWESLFPRRKFPVRKNLDGAIERIERFMKMNSRFFPTEPEKWRVLPIEPGKVVPCKHVEKGIPWADGVRLVDVAGMEV